jgi:hypothetical protein
VPAKRIGIVAGAVAVLDCTCTFVAADAVDAAASPAATTLSTATRWRMARR